MTFTFVELFAGIGGVTYGFERLGGRCLLAAEYDPERAGKRQYVQEAYQILHPRVKVVGDVFELEGEDVPEHDVLSFTFPCQSFSIAGKRAGFDDVRGTLYFEAMRIAREKKPKIIFAENVKGIVGHDSGKTLDTIVKVANDCGYIIDYTVLNSKYFGVPQNRERWFMIGIREDLIEGEPWNIPAGNTVLSKSKRRIGEWANTFNFDWPEQSEVTTRLRDILESNVDDKYFISDEKVAQFVEHISDKADLKQIGYIDKNMQGNRVYSVEGIAATLASQTGGLGGSGVSLIFDGGRIRKLTAREAFRLQGFPDNAVDRLRAAGISESQLLQITGNAVAVPVIEAIGERLIPFISVD